MQKVNFSGHQVAPSKIICVGRNYMDHIRELDNAVSQEALIFLKPNSAITDEIHASDQYQLHFESEISFLIEGGSLAGIGFGLDLTRRDLQTRLKTQGLPWERAKAFDKSAVFGDFQTLDGGLEELRIELDINEKPVQRGEYRQMMYNPAQLLREVEGFMTPEDGDILMTGTPAGVGPVIRGDQYTGRIFRAQTLLTEHSWTVR